MAEKKVAPFATLKPGAEAEDTVIAETRTTALSVIKIVKQVGIGV